MGPGAADGSPGAAEAAGPFGKVGKPAPGLGDFLDGIAAVEQVATGELGPVGAGIEQGGRGGTGPAGLVNAVKLARSTLFVGLFQGQSHGNPHPEHLRGLQTLFGARLHVPDVDQITVVEVLDSNEIKLKVSVRIQRVSDSFEVVIQQAPVVPASLNPARKRGQKRAPMRLLERTHAVRNPPLQRLLVNIAQENPARKKPGVGIHIEQALGIEHDGFPLFGRSQIHRDAPQKSADEFLLAQS